MKRVVLWATFIGFYICSAETPKILRAAIPGYPRLTSGGALEGEVLVDIELAPDGAVRSAQAKSGASMLRVAAETAAMHWRFAPNASEKTEIVFAFVLQEGIRDPPEVASQFSAPNRIEIFVLKREVVVISDPPVEDVTKKQKKTRRP